MEGPERGHILFSWHLLSSSLQASFAMVQLPPVHIKTLMYKNIDIFGDSEQLMSYSLLLNYWGLGFFKRCIDSLSTEENPRDRYPQ